MTRPTGPCGPARVSKQLPQPPETARKANYGHVADLRKPAGKAPNSEKVNEPACKPDPVPSASGE